MFSIIVAVLFAIRIYSNSAHCLLMEKTWLAENARLSGVQRVYYCIT